MTIPGWNRGRVGVVCGLERAYDQGRDGSVPVPQRVESDAAMGLCVTFVSGPRRSGKSAVIQMMIDRLWRPEPHYIRLVSTASDKRPPKKPVSPPPKCGVSSARWLEYDADHIFEIVPEALTAIHRRDRFGSVVIEADADAVLRHAYPYDHRVFVMPLPSRIEDVFRDPRRAAVEFQRVLDDTQAFASEIFGLFADNGKCDCDPSEERSELSPAQMRAFLHSPLGDELATRIQLQQPYHGLVESDVLVVNTGAGTHAADTDRCLRRIDRLLSRTRGRSDHHGGMFQWDLCDDQARVSRRLLKALKPMCLGGK